MGAIDAPVTGLGVGVGVGFEPPQAIANASKSNRARPIVFINFLGDFLGDAFEDVFGPLNLLFSQLSYRALDIFCSLAWQRQAQCLTQRRGENRLDSLHSF